MCTPIGCNIIVYFIRVQMYADDIYVCFDFCFGKENEKKTQRKSKEN